MKAIIAVLCLLICQASRAETLFEIASSVTDVAGMRRLANSVFPRSYPDSADVTSFCEGVFEPPGFYFLNISLRSGPLYEEAFVFQGTRDHLRLRAHLPAKYNLWRKAEWVDGKLVISEQPNTHIDMTSPEAHKAWRPIIELVP